MKANRSILKQLTLAFILMSFPAVAAAQGEFEDYERADRLSELFDGKVTDMVLGQPTWVEDTDYVWYRKSVTGGFEFIHVDASNETKQRAFNHERLATALSDESGEDHQPLSLPFNSFEYGDEMSTIEVSFGGNIYTCSLDEYSCESEPDENSGSGWQSWGMWDHEREPVNRARSDEELESPDGKLKVFVHNYNVAIRNVESGDVTILSTDGSEKNYYNYSSFQWSPDSEKLAAYRVIPGYDRKIHYVESSPEDQLQPRYLSRSYQKPGDVLDKNQPVLFHVDDRKQVNIDNNLFPNAYSNSSINWWEDGRAFYFEYNQRGHQAYRIIEVDGETGEPRALINEEPETFFSYATSRYRHYSKNGEEIIWMSERDGWRHLYLYDGVAGELKTQITQGDWVVRNVDHVDEENRQIWFRASGLDDDQDPYYIHYLRINFDGSGLTRFTKADGNHSVSYSSDREYYVNTWSQVDQAPVTELRRTSDQSLIMTLERADKSALVDEGWQAPEQFSAKGRDGETDIYGVIIRPTNFDPEKEYPVIEYIYAGPHDNFVPKSFIRYHQMMRMAELGFIVVQIDGMGTANRSKAFHDVAWRNLKDAGFPDRILWHEKVADTYSWYDNSRVGIYGRSAGGQSSTGALLFHPEHYHVAVSSVGCHDNRMDKIWWNEQWMGWPIGEQYSESSNIDHADKLQGNLLLVVGELDTNVDPASTYQLADALIKADKDFQFLSIPGAGHGSIGAYEERKRRDFFVEHLLDKRSPNWNMITSE